MNEQSFGKCVWLAVVLSLPVANVNAEAPSLLHYQGKLVDGTNLVSGIVQLDLKLYSASAGGTLLLHDENVAQTVVDGLYDTMIGDGLVSGSLDEALTNAQVWLEVSVNSTPLTPRERLVSVPYARMVHGLSIGTNDNVTMNSEGGDNDASGRFSTVSGGYNNKASGEYGVVGGGRSNLASASRATVGGGHGNTASAERATVAGGADNTAEGLYSSVGGGEFNAAQYFYATVAGGSRNQAVSTSTTVGGGYGNRAAASYATISGGLTNRASGFYSVIAGGAGNFAIAAHSTIGGGFTNEVSGIGGTIPGGALNLVQGDYAFAAGWRAYALHDGTFVWADQTEQNFLSTRTNEFAVRAGEGLRLASNAGHSKPVELGRRFRDNAIIAWGRVRGGDGLLEGGFGVASVTRSAAGWYDITITATPTNNLSIIPVVSPEIDTQPVDAASVRIASYDVSATTNISVFINNGFFAPVDNDFTFIITGR